MSDFKAGSRVDEKNNAGFFAPWGYPQVLDMNHYCIYIYFPLCFLMSANLP